MVLHFLTVGFFINATLPKLLRLACCDFFLISYELLIVTLILVFFIIIQPILTKYLIDHQNLY